MDPSSISDPAKPLGIRLKFSLPAASATRITHPNFTKSVAFLDSLPPYRCPADPLAPYFSATLYPCLIWSSAGHLADSLAPYVLIHCMRSLHRVTLYIVVNICEQTEKNRPNSS